MKKEIYIALVDDWELRGTGQGNVLDLQVKPMNGLMDVYEKYGIKCTFNVETMQQLKMREFQGSFPELKMQADAWDAAVISALKRGHDVQLHIHPQWLNAYYTKEDGWKLAENWDITKYNRTDVDCMIKKCMSYLNDLFKTNNIFHKLCAYRAGSWAFAPSDFMIDVLKENGIVLDMSLVKGLKYDTKHVVLDYTLLEEETRPFYPVKTDARKVSDKVEGFVCVPTFRYKPVIRWAVLGRLKEILKKRPENAVQAVGYKSTKESAGKYSEWEKCNKNPFIGFFERQLALIKPCVADLSTFRKVEMKTLIKNVLDASRKNRCKNLALIIENHTKDIKTFENIEWFIKEMQKKLGVHFITINEMVDMINNGQIDVVKK